MSNTAERTRLAGQIGRFLVIGSLSAATDLGGYYFLTNVGLPVGIAKGISFVLGMVLGWIGNKFWTFASPDRNLAEPIAYLCWYTTTLGLNVLVNAAAYWVLGQVIADDGAKAAAVLIATGASAAANFAGLRWIVFARHARAWYDTCERRTASGKPWDTAVYIAHRINTVQQLQQVPPAHGIELDLRDRGDRLILQHDPFKDGEDFSAFLPHYRHGVMILNVKSEAIEPRVLEELRRAGTVSDYFFLDCSFPMMNRLMKMGEHRIAVRFSEHEPLASALALAGKVQWVWVDCFTRLPLDRENYAALSAHFKICIVSPELQGHPLERIDEFARQLKEFPVDAICTKRADLWQTAFGEEARA